MRYGIIADIHSNLEAFKAVLDDIQAQGSVDKFWCLGDVVGYGPDPRECIALLRQLDHICVAGNHERAVTGRVNPATLNADAAAAMLWTSGRLTAADKAYLDNLPESFETGDYILVHGSPRNPINEYIMSTSIARENFTFFKSMYCLAGHTHEPMVFLLDNDGTCSAGRFSPNVKLSVGRNRMIINPGSVGQPRDGIPEASYAIYDSETGIMQLRRVAYDIKTTQDRMMERGLPARLVMRLERGE